MFREEINYYPYVVTLTILLIIAIIVSFGILIIVFRQRKIIELDKKYLKTEVERKNKIELELEVSQHAISLALEGTGIAIFELIAPFGPIRCNDQFAIQLGHCPDNFHETIEHWRENAHPDDQANFRSAFHDITNGVISTFECEIRFLHSNGDWKWLLCRGEVIERNSDGEPQRILGVNLDIDDLKKAVEFAANIKRTQLSLLGSMGHEIRTPLTSIIGYSELLLEETCPEKNKDYAHTILDSGRNLLRTISGVIDISSAKNGKLVVVERPFQVNLLFDQMRDSLRVMAEQKRIALEFKVHESVPSTLVGDFGRIKQISTNIISDSMKFGEMGEIKTELNSIAKDNGVYELEIRIFDNRHTDTNAHVINLFEGAPKSTDGLFGGASRIGFGLSVTKQIIDIIGGKLLIKTDENIGTEYIINIPCQGQEGNQCKIEGPLTKDQMKISLAYPILIVDDDPCNANLIQKILEKFGAHSEIARDGYDAIRMTKEEVYSIIIMDIDMPGIDGIQATQIIRSQSINTPVIALSAHEALEYSERGNDVGISDFISKPISQKELFLSIQKYSE